MDRLKHISPRACGIARTFRRGGGLGAGTVLLLAVLAFLSACASTPPDRIAYNTLDDATAGVITGMKTFNEFYQRGKATEEQRTKVLDWYGKWQAAARLAVKIAPQATAPDPNLVAIALNSAAELVGLIRQLTGGK